MTSILKATIINQRPLAAFDRVVLRMAEGIRCPNCNTSLSCFPEALEIGFRIICADCHCTVIEYGS